MKETIQQQKWNKFKLLSFVVNDSSSSNLQFVTSKNQDWISFYIDKIINQIQRMYQTYENRFQFKRAHQIYNKQFIPKVNILMQKITQINESYTKRKKYLMKLLNELRKYMTFVVKLHENEQNINNSKLKQNNVKSNVQIINKSNQRTSLSVQLQQLLNNSVFAIQKQLAYLNQKYNLKQKLMLKIQQLKKRAYNFTQDYTKDWQHTRNMQKQIKKLKQFYDEDSTFKLELQPKQPNLVNLMFQYSEQVKKQALFLIKKIDQCHLSLNQNLQSKLVKYESFVKMAKKFRVNRKKYLALLTHNYSNYVKLHSLLLNDDHQNFISQLNLLQQSAGFQFVFSYLFSQDINLQTPISLIFENQNYVLFLSSINDWSLRNTSEITQKFTMMNKYELDSFRKNFNNIVRAVFNHNTLNKQSIVEILSKENTLLGIIMKKYLNIYDVLGLAQKHEDIEKVCKIFTDVALNLGTEDAQIFEKFTIMRKIEQLWANSTFIRYLNSPHALNLRHLSYNFMHGLVEVHNEVNIKLLLTILKRLNEHQKPEEVQEVKQNFINYFNMAGESPMDIVLSKWSSTEIEEFKQNTKIFEDIHLTTGCLNKVINNKKLNHKQVQKYIIQCLYGPIASRGYIEQVISSKIINTKAGKFVISNPMKQFVVMVNTIKLKMCKDGRGSYPLLNYLARFREQCKLSTIRQLFFPFIERKCIKKKVIILLNTIGLQKINPSKFDQEKMQQIHDVIYYHESLLFFLCKLKNQGNGSKILNEFLGDSKSQDSLELFINYSSISLTNSSLETSKKHFLIEYIRNHQNLQQNSLNKAIISKTFGASNNQKFVKDYNMYVDILRGFNQNINKGSWFVQECEQKLKQYVKGLASQQLAQIYYFVHRIKQEKKESQRKVLFKNQKIFYKSCQKMREKMYLKDILNHIFNQRQIEQITGIITQQPQNLGETGLQSINQISIILKISQRAHIQHNFLQQLRKGKLVSFNILPKIEKNKFYYYEIMIEKIFSPQYRRLVSIMLQKHSKIDGSHKNTLQAHYACICCLDQDIQYIYGILQKFKEWQQFTKTIINSWDFKAVFYCNPRVLLKNQFFCSFILDGLSISQRSELHYLQLRDLKSVFNTLQLNYKLLLKILQNYELRSAYVLSNQNAALSLSKHIGRQILNIWYEIKMTPKSDSRPQNTYLQEMIRFHKIIKLLKIQHKVYYLFGLYIELHNERINLTSFINKIALDDYYKYFAFLKSMYVAIMTPGSTLYSVIEVEKKARDLFTEQFKQEQSQNQDQLESQQEQSQQQNQQKAHKQQNSQIGREPYQRPEWSKLINHHFQNGFVSYDTVFFKKHKKYLVCNLTKLLKQITVGQISTFFEVTKPSSYKQFEQTLLDVKQFKASAFLALSNRLVQQGRLSQLCSYLKSQQEKNTYYTTNMINLLKKKKKHLKVMFLLNPEIPTELLAYKALLTNISYQQFKNHLTTIKSLLQHSPFHLRYLKYQVSFLCEAIPDNDQRWQYANILLQTIEQLHEYYYPQQLCYLINLMSKFILKIKTYIKNNQNNNGNNQQLQNQSNRMLENIIKLIIKLNVGEKFSVFCNLLPLSPKQAVKLFNNNKLQLNLLKKCFRQYPQHCALLSNFTPILNIQWTKDNAQQKNGKQKPKVQQFYVNITHIDDAPLANYCPIFLKDHPNNIDLFIAQKNLHIKITNYLKQHDLINADVKLEQLLFDQSEELKGNLPRSDQNVLCKEKEKVIYQVKRNMEILYFNKMRLRKIGRNLRKMFFAQPVMDRYSQIFTASQMKYLTAQILKCSSLQSLSILPRAYQQVFMQNYKSYKLARISHLKPKLIMQLIDKKVIDKNFSLVQILNCCSMKVLNYFLKRHSLTIDYKMLSEGITINDRKEIHYRSLLPNCNQQFFIEFLTKYKILSMGSEDQFHIISFNLLETIARMRLSKVLQLYLKQVKQRFSDRNIIFTQFQHANNQSNPRNLYIQVPLQIAAGFNFHEVCYLLNGPDIQQILPSFKSSDRFILSKKLYNFQHLPQMNRRYRIVQQLSQYFVHQLKNPQIIENGNQLLSANKRNEVMEIYKVIFLTIFSNGPQYLKFPLKRAQCERQKLSKFLQHIVDQEMKVSEIDNLYEFIFLIVCLPVQKYNINHKDLLKLHPSHTKLALFVKSKFNIVIHGDITQTLDLLDQFEELRNPLLMANPRTMIEYCNKKADLPEYIEDLTPVLMTHFKFFNTKQNQKLTQNLVIKMIQNANMVPSENQLAPNLPNQQYFLRELFLLCIITKYDKDSNNVILNTIVSTLNRSLDDAIFDIAVVLCNRLENKRYIHSLWNQLAINLDKLYGISQKQQNTFQPFCSSQYRSLISFYKNKQKLAKISKQRGNNVHSCLSYIHNCMHLIEEQKISNSLLKQFRIKLILQDEQKHADHEQHQIAVSYLIYFSHSCTFFRLSREQVNQEAERNFFMLAENRLACQYIKPDTFMPGYKFISYLNSFKLIENSKLKRIIDMQSNEFIFLSGRLQQQMLALRKQFQRHYNNHLNIYSQLQIGIILQQQQYLQKLICQWYFFCLIPQQNQQKLQQPPNNRPFVINNRTKKQTLLHCLLFYRMCKIPDQNATVAYVKVLDRSTTYKSLLKDIQNYLLYSVSYMRQNREFNERDVFNSKILFTPQRVTDSEQWTIEIVYDQFCWHTAIKFFTILGRCSDALTIDSNSAIKYSPFSMINLMKKLTMINSSKKFYQFVTYFLGSTGNIMLIQQIISYIYQNASPQEMFVVIEYEYEENQTRQNTDPFTVVCFDNVRLALDDFQIIKQDNITHIVIKVGLDLSQNILPSRCVSLQQYFEAFPLSIKQIADKYLIKLEIESVLRACETRLLQLVNVPVFIEINYLSVYQILSNYQKQKRQWATGVKSMVINLKAYIEQNLEAFIDNYVLSIKMHDRHQLMIQQYFQSHINRTSILINSKKNSTEPNLKISNILQSTKLAQSNIRNVYIFWLDLDFYRKVAKEGHRTILVYSTSIQVKTFTAKSLSQFLSGMIIKTVMIISSNVPDFILNNEKYIQKIFLIDIGCQAYQLSKVGQQKIMRQSKLGLNHIVPIMSQKIVINFVQKSSKQNKFTDDKHLKHLSVVVDRKQQLQGSSFSFKLKEANESILTSFDQLQISQFFKANLNTFTKFIEEELHQNVQIQIHACNSLPLHENIDILLQSFRVFQLMLNYMFSPTIRNSDFESYMSIQQKFNLKQSPLIFLRRQIFTKICNKISFEPIENGNSSFKIDLQAKKILIKIVKNQKEDANTFAINMLEYITKFEIECLMQQNLLTIEAYKFASDLNIKIEILDYLLVAKYQSKVISSIFKLLTAIEPTKKIITKYQVHINPHQFDKIIKVDNKIIFQIGYRCLTRTFFTKQRIIQFYLNDYSEHPTSIYSAKYNNTIQRLELYNFYTSQKVQLVLINVKNEVKIEKVVAEMDEDGKKATISIKRGNYMEFYITQQFLSRVHVVQNYFLQESPGLANLNEIKSNEKISLHLQSNQQIDFSQHYIFLREINKGKDKNIEVRRDGINIYQLTKHIVKLQIEQKYINAAELQFSNFKIINEEVYKNKKKITQRIEHAKIKQNRSITFTVNQPLFSNTIKYKKLVDFKQLRNENQIININEQIGNSTESVSYQIIYQGYIGIFNSVVGQQKSVVMMIHDEEGKSIKFNNKFVLELRYLTSGQAISLISGIVPSVVAAIHQSQSSTIISWTAQVAGVYGLFLNNYQLKYLPLINVTSGTIDPKKSKINVNKSKAYYNEERRESWSSSSSIDLCMYYNEELPLTQRIQLITKNNQPRNILIAIIAALKLFFKTIQKKRFAQYLRKMSKLVKEFDIPTNKLQQQFQMQVSYQSKFTKKIVGLFSLLVANSIFHVNEKSYFVHKGVEQICYSINKQLLALIFYLSQKQIKKVMLEHYYLQYWQRYIWYEIMEKKNIQKFVSKKELQSLIHEIYHMYKNWTFIKLN